MDRRERGWSRLLGKLGHLTDGDGRTDPEHPGQLGGGVAKMMQACCNDRGGPLINENISRDAGASDGQEMTEERFAEFATSIGRPIEQRTTSYGRVPG